MRRVAIASLIIGNNSCSFNRLCGEKKKNGRLSIVGRNSEMAKAA